MKGIYYKVKILVARLIAEKDVSRSAYIYSEVIENSDIKSVRSVALMGRGACLQKEGKVQSAIDDYSLCIELNSLPPHVLAGVLFNRAVCFQKQGIFQLALNDYNQVNDIKCPMSLKANALICRANLFAERGEISYAIADCNTVLGMRGATPRLWSIALFNRGYFFNRRGQIQEAISDFEKVIAMPNSPDEQKKMAKENLDFYARNGLSST